MEDLLVRLFFCSVSPNHSVTQSILVGSALAREQEVRGETLRLYVGAAGDRPPNIGAIIFVFFQLVRGNFFGTRATEVTYKGIRIGRYAVSAALRSPDAYLNPIRYYLRLGVALLKAIRKVDEFLFKQELIAAVYVNEPFYANGVYTELASMLRIPLYHATHPYRLTRFNLTKGRTAKDYYIVHRMEHREGEAQIGKGVLEQITESTEKINYMSSVPFESRSVGFGQVDVVVYAHSFTDAQQSCGGDPAFLSMYDWLLFTLKNLQGKNAILKAHPGFFRRNYATQVNEWDRRIFEKLVTRFRDLSNITIVDWPMRNNELLASIDQNTLLVSHHSNALLEGAGLGFRCLSSYYSNWQEYHIFDVWRTKSEYKLKLRNPEHVREPNLEELYKYVYALYRSPCSIFSETEWRSVVERKTGIAKSEISRDPSVLDPLPERDIQGLIATISKQIPSITL